MANFPPEIITDITCRLPVKDLLRYRSVSKPWRSMIDDPDFIKMHLKQSRETDTHFTLLLANSKDCFFSIDLDVLNSAMKLDSPKHYGIPTNVVGSCNGLIALADADHLVTLWNPSTRRYKRLPFPLMVPSERHNVFQHFVYGFGHEAVNDDYKVVRVLQFSRLSKYKTKFNKAEVFSVKSNTWKPGTDFPYYFHEKSQYGVLVFNALHWVVYRDPKTLKLPFIVAFDLVTEEYRELPLPDSEFGDFPMRLGVLGGSLCVVFNYSVNVKGFPNFRSYETHYVVIWVMKEYGVKESWTKLCTVGRWHVSCHASGNFSLNNVEPIAFLKSGKEVLMNLSGAMLISFDLEGEVARKVRISGAPRCVMKSVLCMGSLVGLDGTSEQLGWKPFREDKKETKKRKNNQ